ncbi:MAG: zinc transporter ZntB [Hyphomonadaceae bacterium]|nr:zinc transporter ZntB [Hyphomonadaceae bacterium]
MTETHDPPLIIGFAIGADGAVRELEWSDISKAAALKPGERRWLHLNRKVDAARDWLGGQGGLDPMVVSILFQEDTRPRATRHTDGMLLNFRGANLNPGAEPTDMISIRIWATEDLVITTRAYSIRAIDDLADAYRANQPPATHGELVTFIVDRLTFRLEPIVARLEEQADELEAEWLDQDTPPPKQKLAHFRRSALSLRRYIAPQKEAISALIRESDDFLSDPAKLRLREIQDVTTRLSEDLDLVRERAVVIQEQIVEQRGEAMNQRLFVLAIISAVFLPLGFFTGLFGVNIGGMPGVESAYAFAIFCAALVGLTAGLMYLFKKADWL